MKMVERAGVRCRAIRVAKKRHLRRWHDAGRTCALVTNLDDTTGEGDDGASGAKSRFL